MDKSNSCLYLLSLQPVFNNKVIRKFSNLNNEHSIQLYSTLVLNHKDNLDKISDNCTIIYCFNEKDSDHLPDEFKSSDIQKYFMDKNTPHQNVEDIVDKLFNTFSRNIILFSNSIGISTKNISKYFTLLGNDSDSLVIGKTIRNKISFVGFNFLNNILISDIHWNDLSFDNLTQSVNNYDVYLNVLNNSFLISNHKDFRILYDELSKKESWEYCGQEMHERFTHLFIEYKELLK
ncbi:MAG TPA: hypothetical protein VKA26_12300 [Ignavibacteriaceae bacterium]|nr:hypothetical protein [Ignavibacteriaceae bacterium]